MSDGPQVYNIPAGAPFLAHLAEGILQRYGSDPVALARVTVLLPTRRACRNLAEAFLRTSAGEALLLPSIRPLGDVDEDELTLQGAAADETLPMPPLRREFMLARLVMAAAMGAGEAANALRLSRALAELLDAAATEEVGLDALPGLVPEELAAHWQETLKFLEIIRTNWPDILAEQGMMDAAGHRRQRMQAWIDRWQAAPPADPVIAAGSTGTIPATARLLRLVSRLPQGMVVLSGLDEGLDAEAWDALGEEPTHPQHALARLLEKIGLDRGGVQRWPASLAIAPVAAARAKLLREALLPPRQTERWRDLAPADPLALDGLQRLESGGPREEALGLALALRETLEVPGRTAALITPDRSLARRVAGELLRFGIRVDDSAGQPLSHAPSAVFLRLLAETVAGNFAALPLLALLKHPFCRLGMPRGILLRWARRLERRALRGAQPGEGVEALVGRVAGDDRLEPLLQSLIAALAPLSGCMREADVTLPEIMRAMIGAAEAVARGPDATDDLPLWQGEAGEALHGLVVDILDQGDLLGRFKPATWPRLWDALLEGRVVRPRWGSHPRLSILGLLEARLLQADRIILAGLNEGTWPPQAMEDPWLSRPMRLGLGLPAPEHRLGQTAHDFVQAACATDVVLSRATKVDGTPTVPARWLSRLAARMGDDPRWSAALAASYGAWAEQLDQSPPQPPHDVRPRPRPPVAARPRRLSVTQVETLIRDPYAIYARHILGLEKLEKLSQKADARVRGIAVHDALEKFLSLHRTKLPDDATALAELTEFGMAKFAPWMNQPDVAVLWWPRFLRAMRWFLDYEKRRRLEGFRPVILEEKGRLEFTTRGGPFVLSATADRIDRHHDGRLAILDYKTGEPPGEKEVAAGLAPQLPLEAAIAKAGGFPGLDPGPITHLIYLRLKGGEKPGLEKPVAGKDIPDADTLANAALEGLRRWITRFDDVNMPYLSRPRPKFRRYGGDYDHLARLAERLDDEVEGEE